MNKKKTICLFVWIAVTALYLFHWRDSGRSTGAQIYGRIEAYIDNTVIAATSNSWDDFGELAKNSMTIEEYDVEKILRSDYTALAISNIIYLAVTVVLYHTAFKADGANKGNIKKEEAL